MGRFGRALRKRIEVLEKSGANIEKIIIESQETATLHAIAKAKEMTPPNEDTPTRGTGTITGEMKSHWEMDSEPIPVITGNSYITVLANYAQNEIGNNEYYASYVNDGHRLDKHFVPGLMINPYSGLIERGDPEKVGMIVGTKTEYIQGIHMKESAIKAYKDMLLQLLNEELREVFKQ